METVVLLPSALVFVLSIWVVIICPESFLASLDGAVVIFHLLIGALQLFEESHTVGTGQNQWALSRVLLTSVLTTDPPGVWLTGDPTNHKPWICQQQTRQDSRFTNMNKWHVLTSSLRLKQDSFLMFIHVYFWQLADRQDRAGAFGVKQSLRFQMLSFFKKCKQ